MNDLVGGRSHGATYTLLPEVYAFDAALITILTYNPRIVSVTVTSFWTPTGDYLDRYTFQTQYEPTATDTAETPSGGDGSTSSKDDGRSSSEQGESGTHDDSGAIVPDPENPDLPENSYYDPDAKREHSDEDMGGHEEEDGEDGGTFWDWLFGGEDCVPPLEPGWPYAFADRAYEYTDALSGFQIVQIALYLRPSSEYASLQKLALSAPRMFSHAWMAR